MNPTRARFLARLASTLAATVMTVLPVLVAGRAEAVTAEAICKAKLSLANRRYTDRVLDARIRCETNVITGALPLATDCLTGRGDDRLDKKLRRAEVRLANSGSACNGVDIELLGFPGPCEDETGDPFDTADFSDCVIENTDDVLATLLDVYYPPIPDFYRGNQAKCLAGSPEDGSASLQLKMRARERCLAGQDYGTVTGAVECYAPTLPFGEGTGDERTDRDVARAYETLLGAIPEACAEIRLEDLGYQSDCADASGGAFTVLDLKRCFFDANRSAAVSVLSIVYPPEGICGDGVVGGEEQCDDGAGNSDTSPNACREDCTNPVCSDGVTDTGFGETCDDGNTVNGDCCSATCVAEICGDGVKNCNEQCDNGASNSNTTPDACRTNCMSPRCGDDQQDTGEECDDGAGNSDTTPNACRAFCTNPSCHDGVTDSQFGEQCDDGNTVDGDCCSGSCVADICGDGVVNCTEECDDGAGNANEPDKCRATGAHACTPPECTDGIVDTGEACDDGNLSSDDDCSNSCVILECGDGIVQPGRGEECDDGAGNADEPDKCRLDCRVPRCPDGIVDTGETCDDGNTVNGDGCDDYCGECQDGVKQPAEECDGDSSVCPAGEGCNGDCGCEAACPTVGELTLFAGYGNTCTTNADCPVGTCDGAYCRTVTRLDSGWVGLAHNADINNEVVTRGFLECEGHGPVCGECSVVGIDPSTNSCRCANNNRTICDEPFVADSDDCGGAVCNCYFGSPFPLASGGTPACIVNRFSEPITGTANVDEGAGVIEARLRTTVYFGIGTRTPCAYCGGTCSNSPATLCNRDLDCGDGNTCNTDPVHDDGIRGGTCVLGQSNGLPCDVTGTNVNFPAYTEGPNGGGYSLDCLPDPGINVSGAGLVINLTQTTGTSTLAAQQSCGQSFAPELLCPCLQCSAEPAFPCNTNADCADQQGVCALGTGSSPPRCNNNTDCLTANGGTCPAGTHKCTAATSVTCETNADCASVNAGDCKLSLCTAKGIGSFPLPNGCEDFNCTDIGGDVGECTTGPDATFCAGVVKANGSGILSCQDDEGCSPGFVGVDARPCGLVERAGCFLEPIVATGQADPSTPIGASTFCIPPTSNSGINDVAGLPGPGRVVNQAKARTFCGNDTTQQYIPGVGGCIEGQSGLQGAAQGSPLGRGVQRSLD